MDRLGVNIGDEASASAGEIIRVLVGSGVHGMAIEGTDDRDVMSSLRKFLRRPPATRPC